MLISETPVVSVHIPPALRIYADGHDEVMASGETVGEVLAAVGNAYPALRAQLVCRDGRLAEGICVYLGGNDLPSDNGLATPVALEEVVSIVATGTISCGIDGQNAIPPATSATGPGGVISLGE